MSNVENKRKFDGRRAPMMAFLEQAGVDVTKSKHGTAKLKAPGFMDLSVEWFPSANKAYMQGTIEVSVTHYGEQNGDLMRDPEIVYLVVPDASFELPNYYRNDYLGKEQTVMVEKDGKQYKNVSLQASLISFTRTWVSNLKAQGHKLVQAVPQ